LLPGTLNKLGKNDEGSFVDVNAADFLTQLLKVLGAFDLLEDNNLTGLVSLLNTKGRARGYRPPVSYPAFDTAANSNSLYGCVFWTKREAQNMVKNVNKWLDDIWTLLYGKPLGAVPLVAGQQVADSFMKDQLGSALYTQDNFNAIVKALQDLIAGIDLDMEIVPDRTLRDLLADIVAIDGAPLDVLDILGKLQAFTPGMVNSQQTFIDELIRFLAPAAPVLDFLLFGKDIDILSEIDVVNGGEGKGLLTAFGYNGYQYGLIPIYEALLMPLGAQSQIYPASDFAGKPDGEKLQMMLKPVIYALEKLVTEPVDSLMKLLPNLAYFTTPAGGGSSLLQESLDRVLFAAESVLGSVTGSAGRLFTLDVNAMLDDLLRPLGIAGLDSSLLARFRVGSCVEYTSLSGGGTARYLSVLTDQDRADLLTVILTVLITVVQDGQNREKLVTMLTDLIIPSGFGRTLLHWFIHLVLWWHRLFNTRYSLDHIYDLLRIISWFMPFIRGIQKIFGR
jgi:hypothetical protein